MELQIVYDVEGKQLDPQLRVFAFLFALNIFGCIRPNIKQVENFS